MTNTQELINIGKAAEVLKQAQALVDQAYSLILNSDVRDYLNFDAIVGWSNTAHKKLDDLWKKDNPISATTYIHRAEVEYNIPVGNDISLHGRVSTYNNT